MCGNLSRPQQLREWFSPTQVNFSYYRYHGSISAVANKCRLPGLIPAHHRKTDRVSSLYLMTDTMIQAFAQRADDICLQA